MKTVYPARSSLLFSFAQVLFLLIFLSEMSGLSLFHYSLNLFQWNTPLACCGVRHRSFDFFVIYKISALSKFTFFETYSNLIVT